MKLSFEYGSSSDVPRHIFQGELQTRRTDDDVESGSNGTCFRRVHSGDEATYAEYRKSFTRDDFSADGTMGLEEFKVRSRYISVSL